MSKDDVARNGPATGTGRGSGGVTGKGFMPGRSGNASGSKLPPEVRDALKADTLARYERLKKLSKDAEEQGDIKTASAIELALLKKSVPDLSAIELTGEDGGPIKTESIDVSKLSPEELLQLRAIRDKARR